MKFLVVTLAFLALSLVACEAIISQEGSRLKFGESADHDAKTLALQDANLLLAKSPTDPTAAPAPVAPSPDDGGSSDFWNALLYVGAGLAGAFGVGKGAPALFGAAANRWFAKTPYTEAEKAEIAAIKAPPAAPSV